MDDTINPDIRTNILLLKFLHLSPRACALSMIQMIWFFLCLEPGSSTYLCQESLYPEIYKIQLIYKSLLYRSESFRRRLRSTAPYGSSGLAIQARQAYRRRYLNSSITCRSTWQLSPALFPPVRSEIHDGDAK